jgi:hypothetical protein
LVAGRDPETVEDSQQMERSHVRCYGAGGTTVDFVSADGQAVLRYSGLKVWDAAGRELAAQIEVEGQQLALVVNDRDATYPVTPRSSEHRMPTRRQAWMQAACMCLCGAARTGASRPS